MLTPRFTGLVNKENTERAIKRDYQTPPFAATVNLVAKPTNAFTMVQMTLTGAITFNINVGDANNPPMVGDDIEFLLVSDSTTRTATFGTGFASTGALAPTTAKFAFIKFKFNGTVWQETGRTITA